MRQDIKKNPMAFSKYIISLTLSTLNKKLRTVKQIVVNSSC